MLAEVYVIGAPPAVVGLIILVWFRPITRALVAIERSQAQWLARGRTNSAVYRALSVGSGDGPYARAYQYGVVLLVGAVLFTMGTASLLGLYNPYEA